MPIIKPKHTKASERYRSHRHPAAVEYLTSLELGGRTDKTWADERGSLTAATSRGARRPATSSAT